ncbi:hypothetical protein [Streptomyces scabiei]|uniref:hypothetical protein n=1 Tax=Streptomyces scabiei TaxID=1930 RepID=UPI002FF41F5B
MESTIILWLLAISSVLGFLLYVVRGLLVQLPEVFDAWRQAKRALQGERTPDRISEPDRSNPTS